MVSPTQPLRAIAYRAQAWQTAAWDYYDSIGELRFASQWIANALSRVNLVAAAPSPTGGEPRRLTFETAQTPAERRALEVVSSIANGTAGQGQMLASFGTHLTVAGIGWLVAEPSQRDEYDTWNVYSSDEIRSMPGDNATIEIRAGVSEWRPVHPNAVVVKVWRKHPRWSYQPDAPTRGVLGVLREIELLQQHVHASAQSRLAGAGILTIPSEAVFPPGQGPQTPVDDVIEQNQNVTAPEDSFVETLVESMTVPIADRSSAAAVVPLVIRIPGEYVDKVRHLTFATPFDDRVLSLLESAIKRLALGMDIPPEILMGVGGMNHWGAWQVQEEAITLHVEPLAETVCHALTIGFLAPALRAEGLSPDVALVWYDTSELTSRPDKTKQAIEAYDRIELSREAMLREAGLSSDDMPTDAERRERILLELVRSAPALAPDLLVELGLLSRPVEAPIPEPQPSSPPSPPLEPVPALPGPPAAPEPNQTALLAACDVLMHRTLERANSRLRSAAGKGVAGGAASIQCDDLLTLHCSVSATAHATLDSLLDGAWSIVPTIAERCSADTERLTSNLDRYARTLLAIGEPHSPERLADALRSS